MIAAIATVFACPARTLWDALLMPASLRYVTSPILTFVDAQRDGPTDHWETNRSYAFSLYLFGLLPLGTHRITVVEIDNEHMKVASNETGSLATVWNHVIRVDALGEDSTGYTDTIEIRAGVLTFPVWLFAQLFYRHRQRRWRRLLRSSGRLSAGMAGRRRPS